MQVSALTSQPKTLVAVGDDDDLNENSKKVPEYIEECPDGSFKCTYCGKTSGNLRKSIGRQMIQRHVETHMEGRSHTCSLCQKSYRSRHGLLQHSTNIHNSRLKRRFRL